MTAHVADDRRGELVRDGFKVAIIGAPNAGKSTLINTLAQRKVSIVSAIAGTTRDTIETQIDVDGLPVRLVDTAGLRELPLIPTRVEAVHVQQQEDIHEVEREGIERGREEAASSQMQIALFDSASILEKIHEDSSGFRMNFSRDTLTADMINSRTLIVLSKSDLLPFSPSQSELDAALHSSMSGLKHVPLGVVLLSCKQNQGIKALLAQMSSSLRFSFHASLDSQSSTSHFSVDVEQPKCVITRARHREHVQECLSSIESGQRRLTDLVAVSEHLRQASRSLARITGHVDVEQLLDIVFRDFCIGK